MCQVIKEIIQFFIIDSTINLSLLTILLHFTHLSCFSVFEDLKKIDMNFIDCIVIHWDMRLSNNLVGREEGGMFKCEMTLVNLWLFHADVW